MIKNGKPRKNDVNLTLNQHKFRTLELTSHESTTFQSILNNISLVPNAGHYAKLGKVLGIGIWSPDQVLKFSKELQ